MNKNYLKLNDVPPYKRAFHLSNLIWDIIIGWDYLPQKTVGVQFIRAVDSISANIAEGFGRYHKKDKIKFYYYSRASVKECFDWNEKSKMRKLITVDQYQLIYTELSSLPVEINTLIKLTNEKLKD